MVTEKWPIGVYGTLLWFACKDTTFFYISLVSYLVMSNFAVNYLKKESFSFAIVRKLWLAMGTRIGHTDIKPQSVIRPLWCNLLQRTELPAIFHFLVGILLLVRFRRSSLRLQTHEQPSAQQSNEICSVFNDRFGLNYLLNTKYIIHERN